MKRFLVSFSTSVAMIALPILPAVAAGPYDGSWYVDAAPAGNASTSDGASCDGVRLQFQVKDNQIQGSLARAAYGGNPVTQTRAGLHSLPGTLPPDRPHHS